MHKVIIILCLCIPCLCVAQDYKYDFGLSAPSFFRPAHAHTKLYNNLNLFGAIGIDGVLQIKGSDERSMSFVLNAGFTDDIRKFSLSYISKLKTSLYFIDINPSVVVPLRWTRIQFRMGIGALIQVGQSVSLGGEPTSGPYSNLDSMKQYLKTNSRGILPYIALGVSDDIGKHVRLEFTINPTLLDLYEPGTDMTFSYNNGSTNLSYNYQPIYIGFRLFYFFKNQFKN